jgi:3-oxoacyl-[acyl-carrier protein] reductase
MSNKIDLSGRFAVVTGGAQGIGRAIVEQILLAHLQKRLKA